MTTFTTAEVAEQLRIGTRKVRKVAASIGAGINVGGTAGYRYTQTDVDAMWDAMRPAQPITPRRKRRSA